MQSVSACAFGRSRLFFLEGGGGGGTDNLSFILSMQLVYRSLGFFWFFVFWWFFFAISDLGIRFSG